MKKTVYEIKYWIRLTDSKSEVKYIQPGNNEEDAILNFIAKNKYRGYKFDQIMGVKPLFEVTQSELFE